ncbi:hypothetical protein Trydic_g8666 [Trypoxylus dichotomus]
MEHLQKHITNSNKRNIWSKEKANKKTDTVVDRGKAKTPYSKSYISSHLHDYFTKHRGEQTKEDQEAIVSHQFRGYNMQTTFFARIFLRLFIYTTSSVGSRKTPFSAMFLIAFRGGVTSEIHSSRIVARPIVNTCGSPTYELAKYVAKQLAQYCGNTKSFVKNSEHFIEILQHKITNEDLLVSFDVESLFTNVPVEQTLEIVKQQLIPKGLQPVLNNLARLCLTKTYFLWNGEFYEQASGAAMGSPLSPVIANIFMEDSNMNPSNLAG